MTQRKREAFAAMKQQDEGSAAESSTNAQAPEQLAEFELPTTAFGNVVLELGEESLEGAALTSALNDWNAGLVPTGNQVGGILTQAASPILYNQPAEGTHDQQQFVDALFKFTKLGHDDSADMDDSFDDMEWDDLAQEQAAFNRNKTVDFEAELKRMSRL